jgi:signal transduction histidine kinase
VEVFIITGLVTKNGLEGILFLGNESASLMITEGEEELAAILSTQIVQAIENARLFEQTWRAQQDLEIKVKERTQELSKALDNIKEVSKRKTDFILAVSHELRTPLTSVKGYASLILAGTLGDVPQEIKTRLEKINEHSDKLTALIENLLDISRIEAGRVKMNLQPQDLKSLLTKLTEMFTIQLKEKEITLEVNTPEKMPLVLADTMQLERVFINLISNAAKFTPKNGFIRVKMKDLPEFIEIDVSDTGIGIPKENVPFIFQEFFRATNAIDQKIKGTGLGLSLAKQIVEAHEGKIWFETKENEGTTFSFTIPKVK